MNENGNIEEMKGSYTLYTLLGSSEDSNTAFSKAKFVPEIMFRLPVQEDALSVSG